MSLMRDQLFYDQEASNWHYRVRALHINGGGTATRAAVPPSPSRWKAPPHDFDPAAETVTLDVKIAPAA